MNDSSIWDKISENYSFDVNSFEKHLANEVIQIFRRMGVTTQHTILEAGSGSGHLSALLAMAQYKVSLLDFSTESLERAKEFFRRGRLDAEFIYADILKLDLRSRYDVVWNSGVMEHFNDQALLEALKNLRRITEKYLIFMVPNPESLPYMLYRFKRQNENRWDVGDEFLRKDYSPFLRAAGFGILEKGYSGWEITKNFFNYYNPADGGLFDELVAHGFVCESNAYLVSYVCNVSGCFSEFDAEAIHDEEITEVFNSMVRKFSFNNRDKIK